MDRQIRRAALRIQICGNNYNSESTVREGLLIGRGVGKGVFIELHGPGGGGGDVDGGKLKRSSQLCLISVIAIAIVCGLLAAWRDAPLYRSTQLSVPSLQFFIATTYCTSYRRYPYMQFISANTIRHHFYFIKLFTIIPIEKLWWSYNK